MSLIEDLRARHAEAVANAMEEAQNVWVQFQSAASGVATKGGRHVYIQPGDVPIRRAAAAAVAARARIEGFTTQRIGPNWRISW